MRLLSECTDEGGARRDHGKSRLRPRRCEPCVAVRKILRRRGDYRGRTFMKVLLSALGCEPEKGSELEVGFQTVLAAASEHDVWVLTNAGTLAATKRVVEGGPFADRIRLIGIPFGVSAEECARLSVPGFHVHYDRWQRKAAQVAVELDREVDFDLVHHATLASYWTRAVVAAVDK